MYIFKWLVFETVFDLRITFTILMFMMHNI